MNFYWLEKIFQRPPAATSIQTNATYQRCVFTGIFPMNPYMCFEFPPAFFCHFKGGLRVLSNWLCKWSMQREDNLLNAVRDVLITWASEVQSPLMRLKFVGLFSHIESDTAVNNGKAHCCIFQTTRKHRYHSWSWYRHSIRLGWNCMYGCLGVRVQGGIFLCWFCGYSLWHAETSEPVTGAKFPRSIRATLRQLSILSILMMILLSSDRDNVECGALSLVDQTRDRNQIFGIWIFLKYRKNRYMKILTPIFHFSIYILAVPVCTIKCNKYR